jgi:hypothetical protein
VQKAKTLQCGQEGLGVEGPTGDNAVVYRIAEQIAGEELP